MIDAPLLLRIHQIAIQARDVERATRFYRDVLQLPFLFSAPPGLAFFDCGGTRLMLSRPEPPSAPPGSIVYFGVDDIQGAHAALRARGVSFRTEPQRIATLADREVWLAVFEDTEGNTLALMSEPRLT